MNVIISNKNKEIIDKLDIEVIKRLDGEYTVDEIIDIFQNFFFNKMIIDITAIENYQDIRSLQKLPLSFDMNKIILLLDPNSSLITPSYISQIISMGIFNFTTNIEGLKYLYTNPNSYRDVAQYHHIDNMIIEEHEQKPINSFAVPLDPASSFNEPVELKTEESVENYQEESMEESLENSQEEPVEPVKKGKKKVIGFKSVTPGAGSTTLIYLMKKILEKRYNVLAVEVEKRDFIYFNDTSLLSLSNGVIGETINTNNDKDVILVDINGNPNVENFCDEVLYLIEPSIIKINRLLSIKPKILNELKNKKIILCPSLLSSKDVKDFEYESQLKIFYNMKPVDDHSKNQEVIELLQKLGFKA